MATSRGTADQIGHVVDANGVTFHYQTHGSGDPLLLLHAGSLNGDMWQPYLSNFAEGYHVIAPDLPGHGRSGRSQHPFSYRQLADDIAAFITVLDLHKPFIVGFSDGGQIALEIGMRYPALPRALAIGGGLFKHSSGYDAFVRGAVGDGESPEVDTELLAGSHPDWAAWLDQIYGPRRWKPLLVALKKMWTTALTYTPEDFAQVAAPVLVFVGDRDELVPVEQAVEMHRLLPNAELAVVPNADHGEFFFAKVPAFQSIILDFLLRHAD